jgi:hypothetical protein
MTTKLKGKDPVNAEPSKPKMLIFGKPGVGKTWGALDFPSCYYIDTEGGADLEHYTAKLAASGGSYMGPDDGALDFETVIEQFAALATSPHRFQTVVVDSISKLFNATVAKEAERLGDKDAFGASKKPAVAFMRRLIAWTSRLDMNVLFIAHSKPEWGVDSKGERSEIGQTFDCWDKLEYELHLALEIYKQGPTRKAKVRKSRLQGFPDASAFEWSFTEFANRYGADIIGKAPVQVVLATTEQVAEIERLLSIVKVDESDIEKWKTKAGAESFAEFTTAQAAGILTVLNKKLSK